MKVVVLDLELTCWALGDQERGLPEIIEIGAVAVDLQKAEILSRCEFLIKPSDKRGLSEYCTQLTGITHEMLKGKPRFPEAYAHFVRYLGSKYGYVLASWGEDGDALTRQTLDMGLSVRHALNHWNLGEMFWARYGKKVGLSEAMQTLGIEPRGPAHRALPDAENAARVMIRMFHPNAPL